MYKVADLLSHLRVAEAKGIVAKEFGHAHQVMVDDEFETFISDSIGRVCIALESDGSSQTNDGD